MSTNPTITREQLLALIDDMRAAIVAGDSFEGRMTYETAGPAEYRVDTFYRIGNLMGQGGAVFVCTDPRPHELDADPEPDPEFALTEDGSLKQYILHVGGAKSGFRCDNNGCGCNVFHKDSRGRYICNSCDARYIGENIESESEAA